MEKIMENGNNYKILREQIDNDIEKVDAALTMLSSKFNKEDLFVERIENELVIHLNQVDMKYLESVSCELQNEIVTRIYEKINAIRSFTLKGGKRQFVDYNAERKVIGRKDKESNRSRFYYVEGNDFVNKNNEFPSEYRDRVICADSLAVLKKIPDNCVDIIVTSPPYNFGLSYDEHDDTSFWDDYYKMLYAIFDECVRVLKYGGRIVVNVQPLYSDYIPTHHIISNYFINKKLIWKAEIIWEKNNYNCKYCSWGSWKSPASPYMKYTWEFLEVFCKGDLKKNGDKDKIDINDEEFKSWVVAKWSIAPERKMKEYGHPAMFPESLVERVLKLFSYEGDVVLDPFNGAGTTTVVAYKFNRHYLGIDISDAYCKTAEDRIHRSVKNSVLFKG